MIKKITVCGIFTALSIVISLLERFVPLQAIILLPGVKLGLSNCIILYSLYVLGFNCSFSVMLCKCAIVSFLFTGFTSFIYSFFGGILALAGMVLLIKCNKTFSVYGVSVFGAALHSTGQIVAASVMLDSLHVYSYLGLLLIVSLFTGFVVGVITDILNRRVRLSI